MCVCVREREREKEREREREREKERESETEKEREREMRTGENLLVLFLVEHLHSPLDLILAQLHLRLGVYGPYRAEV